MVHYLHQSPDLGRTQWDTLILKDIGYTNQELFTLALTLWKFSLLRQWVLSLLRQCSSRSSEICSTSPLPIADTDLSSSPITPCFSIEIAVNINFGGSLPSSIPHSNNKNTFLRDFNEVADYYCMKHIAPHMTQYSLEAHTQQNLAQKHVVINIV